jgi:hypothetical protein
MQSYKTLKARVRVATVIELETYHPLEQAWEVRQCWRQHGHSNSFLERNVQGIGLNDLKFTDIVWLKSPSKLQNQFLHDLCFQNVLKP